MSQASAAIAGLLDRSRLQGQSTLVTGATGALGRAPSCGLAAAGARLTLAAGNVPAIDACGRLGSVRLVAVTDPTGAHRPGPGS